jgi:DNA-binding NarL/FixJ family response regulator
MKILLADDHDVVRRGAHDLLESHPGWQVCAEATDGRQAVALASRLAPDVAVLDATMPELSGLEATRQIRAVSPSTEILIFTMHDSEQLARDVLAAGAHAYVLKSDAGGELIAGVEAVAEHRTFFSRGMSRASLAKTGGRPSPATEAERLTPREREILQLLAEGKSNWCVGTILGISIKTVETHRERVMRKLALESIVELVHYAVRNHLVTP